MRTDEITLPSGMVGIIREMKVREEEIFSDRKLARSGGQTDALLRACWTELTDSGPYDFEDAVDWSQTLQADRFFVLLKVRSLTYGTDYAFEVSCTNATCREKFEWQIDLDELPVETLAGERLRCFENGNRFETTLPSAERRVVFRLALGADEKKLVQLRRRGGKASLAQALALRIHEIDGVERHGLVSFIRELSLADADHLDDAFDEADFGVTTEIEVECPHCLEVREIDLPFDLSFFMPKKARRKRSRAHSSVTAEENPERSSSASSGVSTAAPDSE